MKTTAIMFFLFLATTIFAQEKIISIQTNPADSTYRLVETSFVGRDTVGTKFLTRWVKDNILLETMYLLARQAEARSEQAAIDKQLADNERGYYVTTLDTLLGAGTYINAIKAEVLKGMQGNWKLVEVTEGKDNVTHTLVIEDNKVTGAKDGIIEPVDSKTVTFKTKDLNLTFSVVAPNALAARDNDKTYYIVK